MTTRETIRNAALGVPGVLLCTLVEHPSLGPASFLALVVVDPETWHAVPAVHQAIGRVRAAGVRFNVRWRLSAVDVCFVCGLDGCEDDPRAATYEVRLCEACHAAVRLDPEFVIQAQDPA